MSNDKKVLDVHQIDKFDESKFALRNGIYTYDDNSLFAAYVDMTQILINDYGMTFLKLPPKFDTFLINLCKYIDIKPSSEHVRFYNLTDKCDDKFIFIEFEIKAVNGYDICVDVKNYKVIVNKTYECEISNYKMINLEIITYLHREMKLTKQDFQSCGKYACENGYIDVVKYLHQEIGLTKQDFQSNDNYACQLSCENGYIDVVKYLHQEIGLSKQDFQSGNNYACRLACQNDHLNVVKYLHQEIGLTKQDFQSDYNYVCKYACDGHIDIVEYLHREIKFTKQDFQANDNEACHWACENGHVDVVKYLHQEIKLTKKDFQSNNNYACRMACSFGYLDVVKYLHQEIGLSKDDFQPNNNYACEWACHNGYIDIVKYLHQEIRISNDINYLSNLQFYITNINKITRTYTITTNDMINRYPELKHFNENLILYKHSVENIEYIDIHLNLPSNKFTLWSNNVKSLCAFFLEENQLNKIKKHIILDHLEFDGIEFTYLENNEYKHYDKSKCLEIYGKLIGNEKIIMDVRIYSDGTYKMTKLF